MWGGRIRPFKKASRNSPIATGHFVWLHLFWYDGGERTWGKSAVLLMKLRKSNFFLVEKSQPQPPRHIRPPRYYDHMVTWSGWKRLTVKAWEKAVKELGKVLWLVINILAGGLSLFREHVHLHDFKFIYQTLIKSFMRQNVLESILEMGENFELYTCSCNLIFIIP